MNIYQSMMYFFGWTMFTLMLMRLYVAVADTRLVYRALRQQHYKERYQASPLWLAFFRIGVPSVLGGPVTAWMDPGNFFSRMSAPDAWDIATKIAVWYSDPVEDEPDVDDMDDLQLRPRQLKHKDD